MNPEDQNSNFNQPKKPGWNYNENPYSSDANSSGVEGDPKYHPVENMSYILNDPASPENEQPKKQKNPAKIVFIIIITIMILMSAMAVGAVYFLNKDKAAPAQQQPATTEFDATKQTEKDIEKNHAVEDTPATPSDDIKGTYDQPDETGDTPGSQIIIE